MIKHLFIKSVSLPQSAHAVFAWHEQPDALRKLIPPDDPVRVIEHRPGKQGPIGDGARVVLAIGRWPLRMHWVAEHEDYVRDRQFVDVQKHGPFAMWRHTHQVFATGAQSSVLKDHVEYALPGGVAGDLMAHTLVRAKLERMFAWRHQVTVAELA